ncbi:MAG: hypothetical protein OEV55_06320 [candidate division Zixibacteria bacterium]|nr:hypothetical protein [candidate division Zixibacteria bacterium]
MKSKRNTKSKDNRSSSESLNQNEEKFLEELIQCVLIKLKSGRYQVKVADAIKAIELREKIIAKGRKISPGGFISDKEKIFWELIDQIRKEELPKE